MKFQLELNIPPLALPIKYGDKILLIGSCFTEHISNRLAQHKFDVLSNPNGIVFTPLGVANSVEGYLNKKEYQKNDLFYLNELWNSWDHHTRFSDTDAAIALAQINKEQQAASNRIVDADWLIITLGSAFQYYLKEDNRAVNNNHRAPSQYFEKKLLSIEEMEGSLSKMITNIQSKNPKINIIFTVSPVRHIRDGLVENNRSKARMLETVHRVCEHFDKAHYFPAYELVIDVLRDYRFFDIDFAHPNYAATSFVWEAFTNACIGAETKSIMKEVAEINIAQNHKTRFPKTKAHKDFCTKYAAKAKELQLQFPILDLKETIAYFEQNIEIISSQ